MSCVPLRCLWCCPRPVRLCPAVRPYTSPETPAPFGGYDKLSEVFNKDNPNLFKDTRWLLTLLINEALLAEDENAQLLEEKRVGRLIHAGNLQEVQNAIFKSFYRGTAGDNSDTENENDGEETTEEGNRAAVQEN